MAYKNPTDPRLLAARRRHYYKNKEKYYSNNKARRLAAAKLIRELKNVPCADCGIKYPACVMDFDHLADKSYNISSMVTRDCSLERIIEEANKCNVVCANCHRLRTHC